MGCQPEFRLQQPVETEASSLLTSYLKIFIGPCRATELAYRARSLVVLLPRDYHHAVTCRSVPIFLHSISTLHRGFSMRS